MNFLILGYDENGERLKEMLPEADVIDIDRGMMPKVEDNTPVYDTILICLPWTDKTDTIMKNVAYIYKPKAMIVFTKEFPIEYIVKWGIHRGDFTGKFVGPRNETVEKFKEEYFSTASTSESE
jgi:hypothetical protein